MIAPYIGKFKVTQVYKGTEHDGIDLVGIDSKNIYATVSGKVVACSNTDTKGFGINVKILKENTNDYYIFAHMSKVCVSLNDIVNVGQLIGIEGSTGNSTGSHCHYCVREGNRKGKHKNIIEISGIKNSLGEYISALTEYKQETETFPRLKLKKGGWWKRTQPNFLNTSKLKVVSGEQTVSPVGEENGFYKLKDGNYISKNACEVY